jgi:hypothetical protein
MALFDASGAARRLQAAPLFAIGPSRPGPALRRGALVSVPVGVAMLLELGLDSPTKGAIATGARCWPASAGSTHRRPRGRRGKASLRPWSAPRRRSAR